MRVSKKQTQIQRIKILEKVVGKLYMDLQDVKIQLRQNNSLEDKTL